MFSAVTAPPLAPRGGEMARQGGGHHEADAADEYSLGGHSFVTPLATRATNAKTAIVVTTKARSAIVSSWNEVRMERTLRGNRARDRIRPPLTAP